MDKLPKISEEALKKLFEDPEAVKKVKEYVDKIVKEKQPPKPYFHCDMCRDTKKVLVCGGPSRDCPCCGPRY